MGLFSKIAVLVGIRPDSPSAARSPRSAPARYDGAPRTDGANGQSSALATEEYGAELDSPIVEVRPLAVGAGALPVRRNKQELLDDLEKSYREVVELVRKVDSHLDKADRRADRMVDVADRLLEVVQRMPDSEHGERRHEQQVELLGRLVEEQRSGVDRLDTALARIGVQAEVASQSHEQLVMTMAEFRETMCDVARSNTRSAQAVEAGNEQKRVADEQLTQVIVGNQRWMLGILAASMVLAAAALVLAIVAVVRMGG